MAGAEVADAPRIVKRFYKDAAVEPAEAGHAILLDGRSVLTPARNALAVPTARLAAAIVEEWQGQGMEIDPRTMPLTGLANAAIDRAAPDPAAFAGSLALYAESDLLCYRSEGPEALVRLEAEAWDPLLAWARRRFDIDFAIVRGAIHRRQPASAVERLGKKVAALDPFRLAGLAPLVTVSGSLVIALALAEGETGLDAAWAAAALDEAWQAEQWGEDAFAAAALAARRREFEAAYLFLNLL
jgi:chaperone required for assembly of F1-ATPase